MNEKKSEMSLDEVLSSIKKMVVDTEPPVLDLTDMVAEDGSIVKVGENETEESMGAFLKLAQDNADEDFQKNEKVVKKQSFQTTKDDVIVEILKDIAAPEVKKWLNSNLPAVASEAVQPAIHKWMDVNVRKWLDENLPQLVSSIVEREIRNLLDKRK